MNLIERIKKLEQSIAPGSVHIIIWEKFKGITKEQAILDYKLKNNVKSLDDGNLPYIIVCVPTDEEIKEGLKK